MSRARRLLVLLAVVAAVIIGSAAPASADHSHRALATIMTGGQEFPGPGDPDGVGLAGFVISVERGRICYALAVKRIDPATVAHIHPGAAGTAAPPVVDLVPPTRGFSAACATVDPALAADIAHRPDQYYVNVHNAAFPGGAIRGQLG
jgi:hypothetical protein